MISDCLGTSGETELKCPAPPTLTNATIPSFGCRWWTCTNGQGEGMRRFAEFGWFALLVLCLFEGMRGPEVTVCAPPLGRHWRLNRGWDFGTRKPRGELSRNVHWRLRSLHHWNGPFVLLVFWLIDDLATFVPRFQYLLVGGHYGLAYGSIVVFVDMHIRICIWSLSVPDRKMLLLWLWVMTVTPKICENGTTYPADTWCGRMVYDVLLWDCIDWPMVYGT